MDANTSYLNYPELPFHRHFFESFQDLPDQLFKQVQRWIVRSADYDYSVR
jgi:hypothetical protein